MTTKIKVVQVKSMIGNPEKIIKVVRALGLRRIGQSNILKDNNCIRGMVNKVRHLVDVELI